MSEESELSDNSINTYDEEQDPPTSKKLKPTPTYSSIGNNIQIWNTWNSGGKTP